ncbi:LuxR C-terminal-related transcriptional regulator [Plantactinospora sp. GCM10030261]|uniref:LuxR C-terminal-related transcriptional regulator n=1 Tax=Plantactinospora sp. GCM10030261 TaxID=3273420 RepID=UPI00361ABE49
MIEEQSAVIAGPSRAVTSDPSPLLAARLSAAPLPAALISRSRLHRMLDAGAAGPVTLVVAPAGWGKTVLLSSWARAAADGNDGRAASTDPDGRAAAAHDGRAPTSTDPDGRAAAVHDGRADPAPPDRAGRIGWVAAESTDQAGRFWAYVAAALGVEPAGDQPGDPGYLDRLADAAAHRPMPAVLILDDLHRVADPSLLEGLDALVRHAAGAVRLVLSSRTDPPLAMHRHRLNGELTEIRAAELAFTAEEAADLLGACGVRLPPELAGELWARTEGWPAGLRLAALALRDHPDPARYVATFGGDVPEIAGYLTQEVLADLTAEARDAVRRAVVSRRITGDLLEALTGRGDGDRLLAEAERTGVVIAVGTRPAAWRCHRLLGDLFRAELAELPGDELLDLHRRAVAWAVRHGRPDDGLRHALAAADWHRAGQILLDHWPVLVSAAVSDTDPDQAAMSDAPAPPPDLVRSQPEVALARAVDRLRAGGPTAADDARTLIEAATEVPRLRLVEAAVALAAERVDADPVRVTAAAERLLGRVDPTDNTVPASGARALAHQALATCRLDAGDLAGAAEHLGAANIAARRGPVRVRVAGIARLALVHALRGALRAAEEMALGAEEAARGTVDAPGGRPAHLAVDCAAAYLARALVADERDRPDEAETHLALADAALTAAADPTLAAIAELVRARLRRARGDRVGCFRALLAARESWTGPTPPLIGYAVRVAEADLRAANGDLTTARGLLAGVPAGPCEPGGGSAAWSGTGAAAMADVAAAVVLARIELLDGDPRGALRAVPSWDGQAAGEWPLPVRLEAGLLESVAARRAGEVRRAGRVLERVLELAEPEGCRRVFTRAEPPVRDLLAEHLDSGTAYWPLLDDLLRADAPDPLAAPVAPVALGEPLTERELTVLRYLQSILSNVEIASEMSLSVNTVKTHVRNIYRKLDASRRREAVRRARELRLI